MTSLYLQHVQVAVTFVGLTSVTVPVVLRQPCCPDRIPGFDASCMCALICVCWLSDAAKVRSFRQLSLNLDILAFLTLYRHLIAGNARYLASRTGAGLSCVLPRAKRAGRIRHVLANCPLVTYLCHRMPPFRDCKHKSLLYYTIGFNFRL